MNLKIHKAFYTFLLAIILLSGALSFQALAAGDGVIEDTVFLSRYVQTLYDEESAIPVSQAKYSLQTSDGYMWFAGYQGLMRYNGTNTKTFSPDDGFPTYNVNVLFEDNEKNLWIGTNDSGLVLFKDNAFTVFGLDAGLPASSVRDIAEDEQGNVYVATTGGVAAISKTGEIYPHSMLANIFATHIEYIGENRFLCLSNDGAVIMFDSQSVIKTFESGYFGKAPPLSLYFSKDGVLYIGTFGSDIVVTDSKLSSLRTVSLPNRQTINNFFEDSEGRLWVSADNGIGYFIDGRFTPVDGLNMNNSIEHICEDYEGSFWIASSRQGLLQLTRSKFTNVSFAAGLPDYTVNTTEVYNGDLYIGADDGLVILKENTAIENELTQMLDGIRIRSMLVDSKGQLWICTYEQFGVLLVKPGGTTVSISEDNGLASNKVRCIIEADDGSIIVGTSGGVNIIRGEKVIKTYRKEDGLVNDVILSLCQGENGVIYAGSDGGGIYAIAGDTVTNYSEKDGLAAGVILRMVAIDGGLWISTGNAICYMDDTGIRMIDKLMAYDDSVFDIKQIGAEIWFLQSKGLNICEGGNLLSDDELKITQLQRRDGLSAPITANSWNVLSGDGTFYISTGKGVLSVDTGAIHQSGVLPYIGITEVLADGNPLDMSGSLLIPSGTQRVDIYIALLSFASKDGTVSYILEGFDNEIKTASRGDVQLVSYTNLKGGEYTFRLYGTDGAGTRSAEIVLPVNKKYATLEMPLVRLFLILSAIGIISLSVCFLVSHRTKTITRQRQEYKLITGQAISVIAAMTDSKNEYTAGHSRRVAQYSEMIGKRLGLAEDELEVLYYGALLHDIGKISIPDNILNKKPPLTKEEYEIVKTHVTVGGDMLGAITIIGDISLGAKYHHEKIDGTGYAEGLCGDEIPLYAKIISVGNAFDSMLSERPYRKALPIKKIKSEFIHNAGTQFDEKIVAILIEMMDEGEIPL